LQRQQRLGWQDARKKRYLRESEQGLFVRLVAGLGGELDI
jgi:hypothetical protein